MTLIRALIRAFFYLKASLFLVSFESKNCHIHKAERLSIKECFKLTSDLISAHIFMDGLLLHSSIL